MNQFEEAFRKAGIDSRAKLHVVATRLLRPHKNPYIALDSFCEAVRGDEALVRAALMEFLKIVAKDMGWKGEASQIRCESQATPDRLSPSAHGQDTETRESQPAFESQLNDDLPVTKAGKGGASHCKSESQVEGDRPVRPAATKISKSAALSVATSGIFSRRLGGEITIGTATRQDWLNFKRKGIVVTHVADRVLSELPFKDDTTPTMKVATEEQMKAILDSGYRVLDSMGMTNVAP